MQNVQFKNIVLFVLDIETSRRFYEQLLYQKTEHDFGSNVSYIGGLSLWQLSEKHILYEQLISKQAIQKNNRVEVYFEVENIEQMYIELDTANVRFVHRLHVEEWQQKTIRIFDPDHHLVEIGESMQAMVKRLQREGHDAEKIADLTHLEQAFVERLLPG